MTLLLTKISLEQNPCLLDEAINVIYQDSNFLRSSYPLFDQWFTQKVLPGIYSGERTLLIEKRASLAVAYLILKHTSTEKKLCTLRVRPNYESKGLGVRLFQTAFELLETERPLLSVSEPAVPKFERIFKYFAFAQEAAYKGRYIPMINEFAYNGLLDHLPLGPETFGFPTHSAPFGTSQTADIPALNA
ncbi:MAG: hypothetical protein RLZZ298_1841 [Pseudomonadota bacterium]|jgi:GNAT superfamily N-acetyltransferase